MADKRNYQMVGGIDVGNGYVKGKVSIDGQVPVMVDLPSCISYMPVKRPLPVEATDAYMADLVNELECTVNSPALDRRAQKPFLMGERAISSGDSVVMFDINNTEKKKCDEPLSLQLIFGVLASLALQSYWAANHRLPDDKLKVSAVVSVALPIADYMSHRDVYSMRLREGIHTVHINNFERSVTVDIDIVAAPIMPEGAAAQYAISDLGPVFIDNAIAQCRAQGMHISPDEDGETIVRYMNTVGIDIGEGTVNFPVFRNGNISAEKSSSINKGYGSVLDDVVEYFRDQNWAPSTRKGMAEFILSDKLSATNRKLLEGQVKPVLADALDVFADEIVREYSKVAFSGEVTPDVVYVYGGGANGVREALYPQLIELAHVVDDLYKPVLYLDSQYSRDLNRNGLYIVAVVTAQARASKAAADVTE